MKLKKIILLILTSLLILSFSGCDSKDSSLENQEKISKDDLLIGFIHISEPSNMGYTYNHDVGTWKMVENLGLKKDQIINKYNVEENEECISAIEELVSAGCDIIFGTSFGYGPYMLEASQRYPEVEFCHASGTNATDSNLENLHNYFTSVYEVRYLSGIVAGMKLQEMIDNKEITSQEAKLGFVAGFYFEEVISGFTAFYLGARSVCPSATMEVMKVNSWSDPAKEALTAQSLIDNGCLVISQQSDNTTPATTSEDNNVFHCGYNSDMSEVAPKASLVSARCDWSVYLTYAVNCLLNGEKISTDWCEGLEQKAVYLSPLNEDICAKGTKEAIDKASQEIIDGNLKVFSGPFKGYDIWDKEKTIEVSKGDYLEESTKRSAPYFSYIIDRITLLDN